MTIGAFEIIVIYAVAVSGWLVASGVVMYTAMADTRAAVKKRRAAIQRSVRQAPSRADAMLTPVSRETVATPEPAQSRGRHRIDGVIRLID
jgi:hypothetical protein